MITESDLADIVSKMLKCPDEIGQVDELHTYREFVNSIANVVCYYCGGEVSKESHESGQNTVVIISTNECSPEGGGVWEDYGTLLTEPSKD